MSRCVTWPTPQGDMCVLPGLLHKDTYVCYLAYFTRTHVCVTYGGVIFTNMVSRCLHLYVWLYRIPCIIHITCFTQISDKQTHIITSCEHTLISTSHRTYHIPAKPLHNHILSSVSQNISTGESFSYIMVYNTFNLYI